MPIINREKILFPQKNGSTEWVREIRVSSTGYFTIALPPDVVEAVAKTEVGGHSRADVLQRWNEALSEFAKKKAVTSRIIAYRVKIWGDVEVDGRHPLRWGDTSARHDHTEGAGLCLQAGVFDETCVTDAKGDDDCRYVEVPSTLQSFIALCVDDLNRNKGIDQRCRRWSTQMPWTAEREAFFVRVAGGLERLLLDLNEAFKDKKEATKLADGKRILSLTK